MGLFKAGYSDPSLGRFTRSVFGGWKGTLAVAPGEQVEVRLPGSRGMPDPAALELAREIPQRYAVLQQEVQQHLFEHYEPYRDAADAGEADVGSPVPVIPSPAAVWGAARPVRVTIESAAAGRFEIAFTVEWDDEHTVGATVERWKVIAFSGSVGP